MTKVMNIHELPADLEEALKAGEDVTITRDDKPIARVVPIARGTAPLAGTIKFHGDIVEPLGEKWECDE